MPALTLFNKMEAEDISETRQQPRYRQFTIRLLIGGVTLAAVVMVPISYRYRAEMRSPHTMVTAILVAQSQNDAPPEFLKQLDTDSLYKAVLEEPDVRNSSSIRAANVPVKWLNEHLTIRPVGKNRLEILVYRRRSERIAIEDLLLIERAVVEVIAAESQDSDTRVFVIGEKIIRGKQ